MHHEKRVCFVALPNIIYMNKNTSIGPIKLVCFVLLRFAKWVRLSSDRVVEVWRPILIKAESICYSERDRRYCQLSNLCIDFWHTFNVAQSEFAHRSVSVHRNCTYSKHLIFSIFFENMYHFQKYHHNMLNNIYILNIRLPKPEIRTIVYCHYLIAIKSN